MDLKLTDGDMDITNGELSFVTGKEAIAQDITMALRTFLGECVYDLSVGVPWLQAIIGQPNPNMESAKLIIDQIVLARPGVTGTDTQAVFDRATKTMAVTGYVTSIEGEIDFSESIQF